MANTTGDWDGDGASDDRRAKRSFDETTLLSPNWTSTPTTDCSSRFYGGAEALYFNNTSLSGWTANRFVARDVGGTPIQMLTLANSPGPSGFHAIVIWLLEDFQNFTKGAEQASLVGDGTSLTCGLQAEGTSTIGTMRWVIKQGGVYYLSSITYNTVFTNTLANPSVTTTWAAYNPQTNLNFDQNAAVFSPMTFDKIEAVGFYSENDSIANTIGIKNTAISVVADVTAATPNAPVITVPGAKSVLEDTSVLVSGVSVSDSNNDLWKTKVTALHGKVSVSLSGSSWLNGGANNSPTLTLSGPQDGVNATLATLSYIGNTNYVGSDTLTIVATDGQAATVTTTLDVNVLPVNDAPAGTDRTNSITQFTAYVFTDADFGFTDPVDNPPNALYRVKITTLPALGTLAHNNIPVNAGDFIAAADLTTLAYTAPGFGTNYSSFTFQVQDDGGIANGGIDLDATPNTMTFEVASVPINHEPAGADKVVTTTIDTPYTFTAADFGFTDPLDTPPHNFLTIKIVQLPAAGSLAVYGAPVAAGETVYVANFPGFTFTPAPGGAGSPYATFQFQVQDDGGTANGGVDLDQTPNTLTVNVISANSPPVNNMTAPLSVDEDTSLPIALSVTDVDGNLATTTISVVSGTLTVNLAGGAGISYGANGTSYMTLAGSQVQINAALSTLTYLGATNYNGPDTLTVLSVDGLNSIDEDTVGITVRPVEDPPLIAGAAPQVTLEDSALSLYGITVSDPEDDLATTSLSVSHGKLTLSLVPGGATISSGANNSASLTLAGNVAQINEAMTLFTYSPNPNYNGADLFTIIAADSTGLKTTNSVSIEVTPVADEFTWDADSAAAGIQDGSGIWTITPANLNWFDGMNNIAWPLSTGDDSARFGSTSGTAGLIDVENVSVSKLLFTAASAGNYSFTNGVITLGGTNPEISIGTDDQVSIASTITGTNGFGKTGAGLLTLSATNAISGRIGLNSGILRADWGVGIPTGAGVLITNGVWETSQDLIAGWGTGPGQVSWYNNQAGVIAGFSARGTAPVSIQIGTTGRDVPGSKNGNQLVLNAASANQTLTFKTPLSFGSRGYVRVDSTTYPAILTKKWTVGGTGVRQGKVGLGTLILQGGFDNAGGGGTDPNVYQGRLVVDNCSVVWSGDGSAFNVGRGDFGVGKAILELRGTATLTNKPGFGISLGLSNESDLELNGGTVVVSRIVKAGTGVSTLYFDAGTVIALDANNAAAFINGLDNVFIKSGGAILDDGGFTGITVGSALKADLISTGGGLTKKGAGSVVLTNECTYTGPTLVQAGTLVCTIPTALAGGNLDISAGAKLQLDFPGTRQVAQLTIASGTALPNGTYGSSISGASVVDDAHFAGNGTVTVGPVGPPAPELPLTGFTVTDGVPSFTFPTVAGYKYRIVFANDLPATTWTAVIDAPSYPGPDGWSAVSATGENMTITDPSATGQPQRFYRLEAALP